MKKIVDYGIDEKPDKAIKITIKLRKLFPKEISEFGAIYFEEGSEREKEFIDHARKKRIKISRRGAFISCTRSEITRFPFFYLSVKADRDYGQKEKAFDMSLACGGGVDEIFCETGIKQTKKIIIDPKKSKKLDIMDVPFTSNPPAFIVSKRLKDLLEAHGVTGCKFIPCLELGKDYPEEITLLHTHDESLAETADYFQLLITETVINPPSVGYVKIKDSCPKCKTVQNMEIETNPVFTIDDLRKTVFQVFNQYSTSNSGIIRIPVEIPIVSSRILDLILENKMKGIREYLGDPPIQYGIVEIRGIVTAD